MRSVLFNKPLAWAIFSGDQAATVFGSSWTDWHRIFAQTKPAKNIDYMVFFPAHGAIIGAWFGAWPMPLDWERPWQLKTDGNKSISGVTPSSLSRSSANSSNGELPVAERCSSHALSSLRSLSRDAATAYREIGGFPLFPAVQAGGGDGR
nr:phosphatidylinositol-glycan biosynthesis class F protein [Ipomoea batatas]